MDPIEPILPDRPPILPVRGAQRAAPVHRDGRGGAGAQGEQHRRRGDEDAVEVDVEGVDASEDDAAAELEPAPQLLLEPSRFVLTAGRDPEPPAHQIDLSA